MWAVVATLLLNDTGQCEAAVDFGLKIVVWYDRSLRLWAAVYHNSNNDQIGVAGYGTTKQQATDDLKYQNPVHI